MQKICTPSVPSYWVRGVKLVFFSETILNSRDTLLMQKHTKHHFGLSQHPSIVLEQREYVVSAKLIKAKVKNPQNSSRIVFFYYE